VSRGPRRARSLRWRIVAIVASLLTVTNVVVGVVTVLAFQGYLFGRLDDELASASDRAVGSQGKLPSGAATDGAPTDGAPTDGSPTQGSDGGQPTPPPGGDPDHAFIGAPGQAPDTVVAIIRDGTFVIAGYTDSSGTQHRLGSTAKTAIAAVPTDGVPVTTALGSLGDYRVVADSSGGDVFVTALPLGGITAIVNRLLVVIGVVTLLGVAIASWAGAVLVRRSFRPLSHVAGVASSVTAIDLDRGVDPDRGEAAIPVRVSDADMAGSREVGQVGAALNRLLGHVSRALVVRQRAERSVRDFVADASHELRTPIATIRAYADLTRREQASDTVHRNVDRIGAEAVRMGDLVEELLLLARLDAATVGGAAAAAPVRESVDLSAIVVETTMDARAAGPGHRWAVDLDDEPVVVLGDEGQLRRVVLNLLANARVHTPDGTSVTVSLHVLAPGGDTDDHRVARLLVRNDGPPIEPMLLPTLFDRFTRGDAARTRDATARDAAATTGLGLSIVRAVVEAHGGTVGVASDTDGTVFRVQLPLS
jgi:two-component system, OmpR family, sensor kinase